MDKKLLKNICIAFGAVLFFLGLSYGFVPQVLNDKVVDQTDISGYYGMSNEMSEWNKAHPDDPTYWTDAMFGGMPTAAMAACPRRPFPRRTAEMPRRPSTTC